MNKKKSPAKNNPETDKKDRVKSLPGLKGSAGTQFAGYASVYGPFNPLPGDGDEELFYWFVGAQDKF
jgi:hypothetical protein